MREQPFVTSVRVESGTTGFHEQVTIWIRGACVGTLTVGEGDGAALQRLLMPEPVAHAPVQHAMTEKLQGHEAAAPQGREAPRPRGPVPFVMKGPLAGSPPMRSPFTEAEERRAAELQREALATLHDG